MKCAHNRLYFEGKGNHIGGEFEQNGQDRAKYGERLLPELSASVKIRGLSETNLKLCRLFYLAYPHLVSAIKATLENSDIAVNRIRQSTTDEFEQRQETGPEENTQQLEVASKILSKLSFTHLVQLLPIRDIAKRTFYELACIKQTWSVEELKRQINTLYYERSGISKKPEQLAKVVKQKAKRLNPADLIKSPFTFEFLGLSAKDVVYENGLEKALLDHLENFLLELGHGFCFEAKHEHIGQLKTYVNYYKKEVMQEDDNPPVGILLVTNQNKALVEYAIADSDQQLFVSKYLLELPSKKELIAAIEREKNVLREQGVVYGAEE
ncbi:PDDEXK nuclease domain-containing protein [Parapedobacter sp. 2B3]|uniref:PDDEXK nuclease domain-containing protein n=1 Tax=Parapedobacter sp. 2B3 TaxID=3342381 RepID=UPI0035B573E3